MSNCCRISSVRRHLNEALGAALLWLLLAPAAIGAAELGHEMTPVTPPQPVRDFELRDIDDAVHRLSDFRGRVVMLNFWAIWCPPCVREMPSLQRLYDKYRERGLVVVAVNQFEDPDLVFEFTGRLDVDLTFPMLFDRESRVAEQLGVMGLPTTYLLDTAGNIRFRAIGGREFDHPEVEALIEGLL